MRKTALFVLALTIAVLLLSHTFDGQREAIARAQAAASHLRHQRDSLADEIGRRESQRVALERERAVHEAAAAQLRDSVRSLEHGTARGHNSPCAVSARSAISSDECAPRSPNWASAGGASRPWLPRRRRHPRPGVFRGAGRGSPRRSSSTVQTPSRGARRKTGSSRSTHCRLRIVGLQDSVTRLVSANADAYQAGYHAAVAGYEDLTRRYVAELRKPRIDIPTPLGLFGAAAVGLVVGVVVR